MTLTGGRGRDDDRYDGGRGGRHNRESEEGMVRLFINIGKNQNVRPGDILGAIAGESGIPGRVVGSIDMFDGYTFVDVPQESARMVMKAMKDVKIKGKSVRMEVAH